MNGSFAKKIKNTLKEASATLFGMVYEFSAEFYFLYNILSKSFLNKRNFKVYIIKKHTYSNNIKDLLNQEIKGFMKNIKTNKNSFNIYLLLNIQLHE